MQRYELRMPELGIDDGPIVLSLWLVRRGSRVVEGDPLVEVLAGGAVVDLPASADGVLTGKLAAEDDHPEVGQSLAVIKKSGQDHSPLQK